MFSLSFVLLVQLQTNFQIEPIYTTDKHVCHLQQDNLALLLTSKQGITLMMNTCVACDELVFCWR